MLRTRLRKLGALLAVMALVGVAGATYAGSQDGGKEQGDSGGGGPAAIASNLVNEAKFVPITPCRAIDTRSGANTPLAPGSQRGFDVFGTDLSAQGGSASGCGIPTYAVAVEINATAVDPAGDGFLRGAAQPKRLIGSTTPPGALPSATLLNYSSALNATNGTSLPTCNFAAAGTGILLLFECIGGDEIRFQAFTNPTDLVVDLVGYYVVPVFAVVDGDTDAAPTDATLRRGFGVSDVNHPSTGNYEVVTNRDLRGCAITATNGSSDSDDAPGEHIISIETFSSDPNSIFVSLDTNAGAAVDDDFTVIADC